MVTSISPRVAFEYGHTWCALSTMACAAARSMPGTVTASCTSMPKPWGMAPIPTVASMRVSAGRCDFLLTGHKLHGPDEAGTVARSEELLGVDATAGATHFFGRHQLDVEQAVGGAAAAFAPAGGRGVGLVQNFLNLVHGVVFQKRPASAGVEETVALACVGTSGQQPPCCHLRNRLRVSASASQNDTPAYTRSTARCRSARAATHP